MYVPPTPTHQAYPSNHHVAIRTQPDCAAPRGPRSLDGGRPGYIGWDLSGWAHGMMRQDPAEAVSTHQPPFHLPESILNPAR